MYTCPSNSVQVNGDEARGIPKAWTQKKWIHARLHTLPQSVGADEELIRRDSATADPAAYTQYFHRDSIASIQSGDASHLISLDGTVIRTGTIRMVETSREYECQKCQHRFLVFSDLDQGHTLTPPEMCPSGLAGRKKCRASSGHMQAVEASGVARDYQRIKVRNVDMLV
jgi:DNA replicative helicase MCM subunit Mcm2 (Cdc46/Mcm family)